MHRFPHDIIAAEGERQVGDAAAGPGPGAALLDQRQRVDERLRVAVVLGDAGGHGEHVGVEDDVFGREAGLLSEQVIGAAADRHLPLDRVGLPLLVEGHHDHPGAVGPDVPGLLEERVLAFLEADRVDHALALDAREPGAQHAPPGTVDHDGNPGDLGFGRDQVQEGGHGALAVEQAGVHVDVEQVGPAADLLKRDGHGALVVTRFDQPPESLGAGDVGALPDHHEPGIGADLERLEPAEPGPRRPRRERAGWPARHGGGDPLDVRRRGPAAPADHVDHPGRGELAQQPGGLLRCLVIAAEGVRQSRVRMARRVRAGQPGKLRDVRAHLLGAERAIQPGHQRIGVLDRRQERLKRLPRQRPPAQVDDRRRDP